MDFRSAVNDSFLSLRANGLRSVLAMLGITMGIAAVVCTVAIGEGGQTQVQQQLHNLGDNLIWVEAGSRNVNGRRTGAYGTKSLVVQDSTAIQGLTPIRACSPNVDGGVQLAYQDHNWNARFRGVGPSFFRTEHWVIASGEPFTDSAVRHLTKVALIGSTVAENLFPNGNPVGKTIRIGTLPFVVGGVFASKGSSSFGRDQDDIVMMPYTVAMKELTGKSWLDDIMCSAVSPSAIPPAETQISALLRMRHHLRSNQSDDFNIRHPEDVLQALVDSNKTFTIMLASIASVSLLVGGIGIMNIMLVSVTERTREIGIRMAVGARRRDVQQQFLIEAVALCLFGGGVGVLAGVGATQLFSLALSWPITFSASAIAIAVLVSVVTGVFFGYYPAYRAAALHPIEALRHE